MTDEPIAAVSATKSRKGKRLWRVVRRTCFALVFLAIAVPIIAFRICYEIYKVPDPNEIAAGQNQTITLYYSDGRTELGRIAPTSGNRSSVRFQDIPKHVQDAVLAAEDNSFWDNVGFDITGIARAAWNNLTGASGGGSTVTQQYVKKATGNESLSLERKWRELVLAKKMADTYSKSDLLTAYLNTVYFGRGANGIQAAAHAYFGKDIQQVTVSEAALLAGVIQRPTYWDPDVDRENAERRWNFVLDQMNNQGWLPVDRASLRFPATLPRDASPSSARMQIQNQVLAELEELADLRRDEAHQRGYRVITTIDRDVQNSVERAVNDVMTGQPDYLRAAVVSIDPRTGGVLAYHGGGNGIGLDYAQSPQEAGTTFGTFVAVAAMGKGYRLDYQVDGGSPRMIDGIPFQNPAGVTCRPCTIRKALQQPVNTAMAQLTSRVSVGAVADAAYQAGIPRELRGKPALGKDPDTRIAIGSGSTTVRTIDMARAYSTLAARGVRTTPHFVSRVEDITGTPRYNAALSLTQAIAPRIAQSVTEALSFSLLPSGQRVASRPGIRPYGDEGATAKAWMVGYTSEITTAVWMGADKLLPIKNKAGKDITAAGEPSVIWRAAMDSYHGGQIPEPAARPTPPTS
ncbi:membrane peptidoglycan carboxypeptidase [Kibdelosporangium banguiense]|uniref:Membrane peptidoglycan carboxypeptidase n=1 Tax=Kibdelosporangium banguiense TaxID=1365924 RepID=A0ABS4TIL2_9PSEU|nr:transglycosylase domain-containing protein [Kibdelosporangium banguiense]MBP2323859.1 membrane peptidoglycan carboxypeptidase [Kibdelosporangium banguiense]